MENSWLQWLAVFLSATSTATLMMVFLIASRERRARVERKARFHAMWRALRGVDARLTRLDTRLIELEEGVRRLKQHQEAVDLREPGEQLYQQAIRLTRRGADIGELITSCGLSPGEAELVHRVHRHPATDPRVGQPRETGRASVYDVP